MALVDTQGFVLAVDRSLFGPQGRRWIERKLPDVATNVAFIAVSTFGACVLVYHICCDYHTRGYWGLLQAPKHVCNAVVIHIVARALRWHIERMLGRSFLVDDEALPDFFGASGGGDDHDHHGQSKPTVLWPWHAAGQDRSDSMESIIEQDENAWRDLGIAGDGVEVLPRDDNHRSRCVEVPPGHQAAATQAAAAAAEAVEDDDDVDPVAAAAATAMAAGAAGAVGMRSARGERCADNDRADEADSASRFGGSGGDDDGQGRDRGLAASSPRAAVARDDSVSDDGDCPRSGQQHLWRRASLSSTSPPDPEARKGSRRRRGRRREVEEGAAAVAAGGGPWRSIDKISKALSSTRRRGQMQARQPRTTNFFTEADMDELMHSAFFIKMCDDASWLYVEDRPHEPEMNWLLSLWGGYKIAPRFQGEVRQNEAHRMLFQCEPGKHKDHVRIRSRATNTFLFFLGIKQPLTWVAWDRDVVGGDWEDLKLEWVGTPPGREGLLVGDERGRVIIHSRPMNAYVSWNGSRFTHVTNREGATVFMFQRIAPRQASGPPGSSMLEQRRKDEGGSREGARRRGRRGSAPGGFTSNG